MQLLKSDLNPYSRVFLLKGKEGNPASRTASKLGSRFFAWFLCHFSRLWCGLPFVFCSHFSSLLAVLCWLSPLFFNFCAASRASQALFFERLLMCRCGFASPSRSSLRCFAFSFALYSRLPMMQFWIFAKHPLSIIFDFLPLSIFLHPIWCACPSP